MTRTVSLDANTTKLYIDQWARWRRQSERDFSRLWYPNKANFMNERGTKNTMPEWQIEIACEKVYSGLPNYQKNATEIYYLWSRDYSIEQKLERYRKKTGDKISRTTLYTHRNMAIKSFSERLPSHL